MPPLFCIDSDYIDQTQPNVKERIKRKLRYTVRNSRRTSPSDLIWLTFYDLWPKVDAVIIPEHAELGEYKNRIKGCKALSAIDLAE